ncbi:hypothetical protein SLEP1_g25232 [Rubroshorea leprosula]|uniref:Uncharacterized protein n=1 Tax=Rubroshorea leprosula TaxID=152421 RepID=A0AAV5JTR7_9ROSI|nr:hypothetical protein SLEP1_g25232 [Rubroshorea leprosula]
MCQSSTSLVEMVMWDLYIMSLMTSTQRPQIQHPW